MKQKILLFYFLVLFFSNSTAQTIFSEDFGQTTTRQTSAYMPTGSFTWADPAGNSNQKWIENNHYAVIAPANIKDVWPTETGGFGQARNQPDMQAAMHVTLPLQTIPAIQMGRLW